MNKKFKLLAEDYLKCGSKLYFVSKDTNIIYCIDSKSGEINFIDCIPEENIFGDRLCSKILMWNEEMIFVPVNAKKIWRYNTVTKEWYGVRLEKYAQKKNKFFQAAVYKDNLFMFGCSCSAIFVLNLVTNQLVFIEKPFEYLNKEKEYFDDIYFKGDFVRCGAEIMLASCMDNSVMKFDMRTKKVIFYKVGNKKNQYSGIAWDGKHYWLSPRYKTPIVRWDGKEDVVELELPKEGLEAETGFLGVIVKHKELIIPGKKRYSIVINRNMEKFYMDIVPKAYIFYKKKEDEFLSIDPYGNLTFESSGKRYVFKCEADANTLRKFQLEKNDIFQNEFSEIKYESSSFSIDDYLNGIVFVGKKCSIRNENIGIKVWKKEKGDF